MKKYGLMFGFITAVFLIQINVFPSIDMIHISPNLLIIVIAGYGLSKGHKEGLIAGIYCGILMDSVYGNILGYYVLPYMYIGYICGYFRKYLYDDNYITPALLCGASDLAMGIYIFVFSFALRNRLNIGFYLWHIMLPEVIYTVIISLILFRVQIIVNKKIDIWVKKRGRRIVKKSME
ncbi:MAG: rod shape-determining protein MreD [Lachnospiraceae bacterium]|nr:rod shape-determining protein MreD [Lachnospiraceae bacterium]